MKDIPVHIKRSVDPSDCAGWFNGAEGLGVGGIMYLMYYMENGERVYTLEVSCLDLSSLLQVQ